MIEDLRTTVSYLAPIRPLGYHWLMKLVLYTDRLTLIPLHMSDGDIAVELFTDPEVLRFTGGVLEEEEVHRELPKWIRRGGNGCIGVWCITSSDSGEKLGTGALLPMPVEEDDSGRCYLALTKALIQNRRTAADANVPKRLSTLHPCRSMYRHGRSSFLRSSDLVTTPACREKPDILPAVPLFRSSGSWTGNVCNVNTLRPACWPTAMRYVIECPNS